MYRSALPLILSLVLTACSTQPNTVYVDRPVYVKPPAEFFETYSDPVKPNIDALSKEPFDVLLEAYTDLYIDFLITNQKYRNNHDQYRKWIKEQTTPNPKK